MEKTSLIVMPSIKRKNQCFSVSDLDLDAEIDVAVAHTSKWSLGPVDEQGTETMIDLESKWTVTALDKVVMARKERKSELENLFTCQTFAPSLRSAKPTGMVNSSDLVFPGETFQEILIEREHYDVLLYIDDEEWFPK